MARQQLSYHGLSSGLSDGSTPRIDLLTPSGQIRSAPLDRRQLVRIIKAAASALEVLDRDEARAAREADR